MEKILLANDGVAIDLKSIIGFLNSVSSYFVFEIYENDITIEDTIITKKTYKKINIKLGDDVSFFMIFTASFI